MDAMGFPGPLIDLEWVVASRKDMADASGQQNFGGRRIAVVEAQVPGMLLAQAYPQADLRRCPDTPAALRAVSVREVDLAVGWLTLSVQPGVRWADVLRWARPPHWPRSPLSASFGMPTGA
jgi:hypothetical protein